jgi:hypothetical protein
MKLPKNNNEAGIAVSAFLEELRVWKMAVARRKDFAEEYQQKLILELDSSITKLSNATQNKPEIMLSDRVVESVRKLANQVKRVDRTGSKRYYRSSLMILNYLNALQCDFSGQIIQLRYLHLCFVMAAACYLFSWPIITGDFWIPFFFMFPIYMGIQGIRRRLKKGLLLVALCVPIFMFHGALWSKLLLSYMKGASIFPQDAGWWKVLAPVFMGMGLLELPLAMGVIYFSYAYRKAFH